MNAVACFTFDNMAEAAEVGAGSLDAPRPRGEDPSLTIGYPAIFDLLERLHLRATFFIEGWNGVHHPEAVAEIVRRGHELGMHGWAHESWAELPPATERDLARRATRALEKASGVRPKGFRAPGGARSVHTEEILLELGYEYDASLGDGMTPALLPSGLVPLRPATAAGASHRCRACSARRRFDGCGPGLPWRQGFGQSPFKLAPPTRIGWHNRPYRVGARFEVSLAC